MKESREILFVCHESSRTGAPIFLLSFIEWIKGNTDSSFTILIDKGGALDENFRQLGPVIILRPNGFSGLKKIWYKLFPDYYIAFHLKRLLSQHFQLIYVNTIANGRIASLLKKNLEIPAITHIHEMESVIGSLQQHNIRKAIESTDHFIAASHAVKKNLIQNHGVPDDNITIHYEAIKSTPLLQESDGTLKYQIRKESSFLIGCSGFVDVRKGYDIFLQTAHEVINKRGLRNVKFIWVGDFGKGKKSIVHKYIYDHGLEGYVEFTGPLEDPFPVYRDFDLFYLTSREDPFPLVMLENALLGIPVIGFKGTGGVEEFLSSFPEFLISDFNISVAAEKIIEFSDNKGFLKMTGNRLSMEVKQKYTMESCGRKYYGFVKKYIERSENNM